MEKRFKVGQVWRTRDGGEQTIIHITDEGSSYPIHTSDDCYAIDGRQWRDGPSPGDLVELISDVAEEPPAPEPVPAANPTFVVGQVWMCRSGRTVRVEQVEPPKYHGDLVILCEDRHWRRRSGRISDVTESPHDLVRQLPFDEPSAPAIADAMMADAAALAPQHDAEATSEPLPETVEVERRDAVVSVPRANSEERALFDSLVMQAAVMGNFTDLGTEKVLSTIREIIAARRAL